MATKEMEPENGSGLSPRDRVLRTASALFYKHGIHSVGIDRIIAESGVAKMTFYRHFPSKARLVAEYLAQSEAMWRQFLSRDSDDPSRDPVERLLSIFDTLELSIKNPGFCGCPFIKALAEYGPERDEPEVRSQIVGHFKEIERVLARLLKQIRPRDSKKLLPPLMSLVTGTIVVAQATGQTDVAGRNKAAAKALLSGRGTG